MSKLLFESGVGVMELLVDHTQFFPSKAEAKRTLQGKGASINKTVIENAEDKITKENLINNRY